VIKLTIRPMGADEDGWVEVCLITQPMEQDGSAYMDNQDGSAEGETVGYVRPVEGTEGAQVEWWDARVIDGRERHDRRFTSLEAALLALASRPHLARDQQKLVGWV
jgi:hypothetical protein